MSVFQNLFRRQLFDRRYGGQREMVIGCGRKLRRRVRKGKSFVRGLKMTWPFRRYSAEARADIYFFACQWRNMKFIIDNDEYQSQRAPGDRHATSRTTVRWGAMAIKDVDYAAPRLATAWTCKGQDYCRTSWSEKLTIMCFLGNGSGMRLSGEIQRGFKSQKMTMTKPNPISDKVSTVTL